MACSSKASCEEHDGADEEPGGCWSDGVLEILGQAAISIEPGQGSLDDPATRYDFETLGLVGAFDDFDRPFADVAEGLFELVPGVAAVGEDVA